MAHLPARMMSALDCVEKDVVAGGGYAVTAAGTGDVMVMICAVRNHGCTTAACSPSSSAVIDLLSVDNTCNIEVMFYVHATYSC